MPKHFLLLILSSFTLTYSIAQKSFSLQEAINYAKTNSLKLNIQKLDIDDVEGQIKEYYSSISDAVRLYIEGRFGVNALELTTDEIVKAFRSQVVDPMSKEKLQQLLVLSDFVKFAKQIPIEQEHALALQNAFDFVNGTKREEEMVIEETAVTQTEHTNHVPTDTEQK